jgi:hypothetical protein
MALLDIEGFESGGNSAVARTGTRSLSIGGSNTVRTLPVDATRCITGVAIGRTQVGNASVAVRDTAGSNVVLVTIAATTASPPNTITLNVRGSNIATVTMDSVGWSTAISSSSPIWAYLEINVLTNATTGTVAIQINGLAVASLVFSGNTGSNQIRSIQYTTAGGSIANFDDIYVCDGTGSTNNTFLGDRAVLPIYPNAAGDSTQFSVTGAASNWQAVSEVTRSSSEYVASATAGHVDLYNLQNLPGTVTDVAGIKVIGSVAKSDAGARTGSFQVKTGGTASNGTTFSPGTAYGYLTWLLPTNPVSSALWTVSEINSLQAGIRVVA